MSWPLASFVIVAGILLARLARLRALAPLRAYGRGRGDARGGCGARPRRVRGAARRQADHRDRARRRLRARPAARLHGRCDRDAGLKHDARPGPLHAVADGRLGPCRPGRRAARARERQAHGPLRAGARLCRDGAGGQGDHERVHVDFRCRPHAGRVSADRWSRAAVRHHRHAGKLHVRVCLRPRASAPVGTHACADDREMGARQPASPPAPRHAAAARARLRRGGPGGRDNGCPPARAGGSPVSGIGLAAVRARAFHTCLVDARSGGRRETDARSSQGRDVRRDLPRRRLPRSTPRTATAALAAPRDSTAASCTRPGPRSAWPRRDATR